MASVALTGRIRNDILNLVHKWCTKQWRTHEEAVPYKIDDIYDVAMQDIRPKMDECELFFSGNSTIWNYENEINFVMPAIQKLKDNGVVEVPESDFLVQFRLPRGKVWPVSGWSRPTHKRQMPEQFVEKMQAWCLRGIGVNKLNDLCQAKVKEVTSVTNTAGQLRLVWPELVELLPEEKREKLAGTVARVPPREWTADTLPTVLRLTCSDWLSRGAFLSMDNTVPRRSRETMSVSIVARGK